MPSLSCIRQSLLPGQSLTRAAFSQVNCILNGLTKAKWTEFWLQVQRCANSSQVFQQLLGVIRAATMLLAQELTGEDRLVVEIRQSTKTNSLFCTSSAYVLQSPHPLLYFSFHSAAIAILTLPSPQRPSLAGMVVAASMPCLLTLLFSVPRAIIEL